MDARDAPVDRRPPSPDYAPVMCAPGLLFCDDFESGALDPDRWSYAFLDQDYYYKAPVDVSIGIDTSLVHQGTHSLRIRQLKASEPTQDRDAFVKTPPIPLGASHLFLRYLMYVDEPTPNRWFAVLFVSDPAKDAKTKTVYGVNYLPQSDTKAAPSIYQVGTDTTTGQTMAKIAPTGRWSCWEVEIRGDRKEFLLYVDRDLVPGSDLTASYSPDMVQFNFGYANGHDDIIKHPPDGFFDIYIDEVAVGTERLGCGQ